MFEEFGKNELPVITAGTRRGDLNSDYIKEVENLCKSSKNLGGLQKVLHKIFGNDAEKYGELLIVDERKNACYARNGIPFSNFAAIPVKVIRQISEKGTEDIVELLVLGKDVPKKFVNVRLKDLGSASWIDNLGINYIYEKQEIWNIRVIIQIMARYAPVCEEFLYSGWAPDGDNYYIMHGLKLCSSDWRPEHAKASCEHTLRMLDVAQHSLTFVLLAIAILSLFQSKMIKRGVFFKGICSIVAQTQSFKTSIASLFFDWSDGKKADVSFEATMAAIIRTIGNSRDLTVILDDFKPGATKVECRDMMQKISTVIRLCSDDSGGIKRASVHNETISNIARCLVVVTAEHLHFEVQSTLARILILEMNGKSVDIDTLTYFQENHSLYCECMENFVKYVIHQGADGFCEHLEQRFLQERNILKKELLDCSILVDNRTGDMCTWLNIAFSEFLIYAFSAKAITSEDYNSYVEVSKKIFLSLMEQQAGRVAKMDNVRQFFKGLQVLLETRDAHIGILQSRNVNYASADSKSAIGFRKKGYVYLKNDVAFQRVASYFQRNGREFAYSETELRKKLADRGYINQKDGKSYIHRLSVNHESYQCIQFKESEFYSLLKGGENARSENKKEVSGDWGVRQNANAIIGGGIDSDPRNLI